MQEMIEEGIKVDCLITDVPYNLVQKMWGSIHLFRQSAQDWTESVTEDNKSFDHWFNQTLWLKKAMQLLKPWWNIIIFNDWENMWIVAYELRRLKIKVKTIWHWQKTNPMPSEWKRRFVPWREYFLHASKKWALHTFNVDAVHKWEFKMGLTKMSEKRHGTHANMKPLQLMKELIEIVTNEWDTILDPFMGSWSTGIAANLLNREFIWIELDTKFFEIAEKRFNNITDYDN